MPYHGDMLAMPKAQWLRIVESGRAQISLLMLPNAGREGFIVTALTGTRLRTASTSSCLGKKSI